jgi:hypothetical protein
MNVMTDDNNADADVAVADGVSRSVIGHDILAGK